MAEGTVVRLGAYEKYLALQRKLVVLTASGEDDERGDALRDEMDPIWECMTEEERELAEGTAARCCTRPG